MSPVFGVSIAGTPVYVATPAQLEVLKAMPAKTPEQAQAEQAEREAAAAGYWSNVRQSMGLASVLPPPPARHPFRGANRAQRRAMAAERRRA